MAAVSSQGWQTMACGIRKKTAPDYRQQLDDKRHVLSELAR
jgi:hypothetical protein